jgi:hypothetical protein
MKLRGLLLAVAVATMLSHVCVLPHEHAEAMDEDREAGHDALHGASCEALRASPTQPPLLDWIVLATAPDLGEPPASHVDHSRAVVARAASPPLFLLHASLLI